MLTIKFRLPITYLFVGFLSLNVLCAFPGASCKESVELKEPGGLLLAAKSKGTVSVKEAESPFLPTVVELESLVKKFYPRAKLVRKGSSLKAEFKLKQSINVYTRRPESIPDYGGISVTAEIRPGKYEGRENLGTDSNQFHYTKLTFAPYSKAADQHLFAQISFPNNVSSDFVTEFRDIMDGVPGYASEDETVPSGQAEDTSATSPGTTESPSAAPGSQAVVKKEETAKTDGKTPRSGRKLFFWKATRGNELVYLLGTIHVAKRSFYPLPRGILDAFNETNHLLLEIDISDREFIKKSKAVRDKAKAEGSYKSPDKLQDHLTPRTKEAFDEFLAWSGDSWAMYEKYKPWLATDMLCGSLPRRGEITEYKGRYGIDAFLIAQALVNDVKVGGLEPPDREFFARLPEPVQDSRLLSLLVHLKNSASDLNKAFEVWKSGDLKGMYELDLVEEREFPNLRIYNKVLLDDRNIAMVDKLMEIMKSNSGPFFVAVGSAHMPGEKGMLQLMRDKGFKVEQVENPRPSFHGLSLFDVSEKYTFADGPCLADRERLYNEIQACSEKGIGIQGYVNNLDYIEGLVKSGAHRFEIERQVDKVENTLAKQVSPFLEQIITPYCIKIERLVTEQMKSVPGMEKGCILACTVYDDGRIEGLRKSKLDGNPDSKADLAIARIKSMGKFPSPPKSPLRLMFRASSNHARTEAWHRGVIDRSEFVNAMLDKVRTRVHIRDFPSGYSSVKVEFRVLRDGTVDRVKLIKSCGKDSADDAVLKAVRGCSPLRKLPDGYKKSLDVDFTLVLKGR